MTLHAIRQTLAAAAAAFGHAQKGYVLAALGLYLASIGVVTARWRIVLAALGRPVRSRDALLAYLAGVCAGNVTPARTLGGDACRAALLCARADVPARTSALSVFYDRLADAPAIAALALVAVPTLWTLAPRAYLWPAAAVALLIAAAVAVRRAPRLRALAAIPISRRGLTAAVGCSCAVWLQDMTRIALVAAAFGVSLTPSRAAALSVLAMLGGLAPIAGGIGVVEAGLIGGLMAFGTPAPIATAITVVERAISYVVGTAAGAVALLWVSSPRPGWRRWRPAPAVPEAGRL